jgi:ATP synthase protein I
MGDEPEPKSLQDLEARIKRLQTEAQPKRQASGVGQPMTGMGMAFAISAHMVAGLGFGTWLGYTLDRWLGTSPALLVTFFLLGAAAGGLNVHRTVKGMGMALGYRPAGEPSGSEGTVRNGPAPKTENNERRG